MILNTKLNIIFFGSSSYCLPVLESLKKNFHLIGIVTKPGEIKKWALNICHAELVSASSNKKTRSRNKFGMTVTIFTPTDKAELSNLKSKLEKLQPDIAIVADYGLIIPQEIINIPKYKTINIHFSRLPDLRGASPVQYTILRGDKSAWISYMLMDKGLDTGDILFQSHLQEDLLQMATETTVSLYRKLFSVVAKMLPEVIQKYVKGDLIPIKQNHTKATYTKLLTRQDGFIPWEIIQNSLEGRVSTKEAVKVWSLINIFPAQFLILNSKFLILRALRAFSPWPGVWTEVELVKSRKDTPEVTTPSGAEEYDFPDGGGIKKKRLKILKAHLQPTTDNLQLDLVQLEGKNPVSWKQFREGYRIF